MCPEPSSVAGSNGKIARFLVAMLVALSTATTGLGEEADAIPGSAASPPAPVVSGRMAGSRPDVKSPASEILDFEALKQRADSLARSGLRWYLRTPAAERMSWGGLFACAGLGLMVLFERAIRLRPRQDHPRRFHGPVPRPPE